MNFRVVRFKAFLYHNALIMMSLAPYYESEVINISGGREELIHELLSVWEDSVRASHSFLSNQAIADLKPSVSATLREVPKLYAVLIAGERFPGGFMGVRGDNWKCFFCGMHAAAAEAASDCSVLPLRNWGWSLWM